MLLFNVLYGSVTDGGSHISFYGVPGFICLFISPKKFSRK
uniref:Uncharacterized protein n=1 Tax=Rhizophora mucronata TaxID=61149 RepID=A0A2P2P4W3_RHIMU